ncbi:RNA-binding protein 41-like [Rhopilema esculentum]|uniref:RNA-binding protein 41-like n=1 Tax=Rhopilema esculentum TaxID=499914 RepID=UPI0031D6AED6
MLTNNHGGSKDDGQISSQRKRFRPDGVIKMGPQAKVPYETNNVDEPPKEKQISEAELQLKSMVQKQLATNITLESELSRKKIFHRARVYKDEQEKRAGQQTLESFKQISDLGDSKETRASMDQEKFDSSFTGAKEMTRHELEIEQSLYRGTKKAEELKHLLRAKTQEFPDDDPVMKTLKEYEDREKRKRRSAKTAISLGKQTNESTKKVEDEDEEESDNEQTFVGPILAPIHVRVRPLDEKEVSKNKLDVTEIRSIAKFSNYEPGVPSKKLYIKNLPRNTTKEDLAELFVRFESLESPVMEYRIMDGRMKGQAFVQFKDVETSRRALEFANGYIMKGKPIIICYGKDTNG